MSRIVNEDDVDVCVLHALLSDNELDAARGEARSLLNRLRPLVKVYEADPANEPFPAVVKAMRIVSDALEEAADLIP
jgi:hypothetical protein